MGGHTLSDGVIAEIKRLWGIGWQIFDISVETGVSFSTIVRHGRDVPRPPCGCGREAGHRGHCKERNSHALAAMKASRESWTHAADGRLLEMYAKGESLGVIAAEMSSMLGEFVTTTAVASRAARVMARRPGDYRSYLRKNLIVGRKKGTKNKRPYVRRKDIPRDPVTGRYMGDMDMTIAECDAAVEWIVKTDIEASWVAACRRGRIHRTDAAIARADFAASTRERAEARVDERNAVASRAAAKVFAETVGPSAVKSNQHLTIERVLDGSRPIDFRFVSPDAPNVLPTARPDPATKGRPFGMSAMSGPDPMQALRLRQRIEASKGRV